MSRFSDDCDFIEIQSRGRSRRHTAHRFRYRFWSFRRGESRLAMTFGLPDAAGHRGLFRERADNRQLGNGKRAKNQDRNQPAHERPREIAEPDCLRRKSHLLGGVASGLTRFFSSFILHFGHLPAFLFFTSSCMGQM